MPSAPRRSADWTARFIARRNAIAALELVGDALRDEPGVDLRLADLDDVRG